MLPFTKTLRRQIRDFQLKEKNIYTYMYLYIETNKKKRTFNESNLINKRYTIHFKSFVLFQKNLFSFILTVLFMYFDFFFFLLLCVLYDDKCI